MKSANKTYISSLVTGFQSRILERNGMKLLACIFVLHKCLFRALLVPPVCHQKHFEHFSTMKFILGFILRPTVLNKLFPLPYIVRHVLPRKCSTRSSRRTGCRSTLHIVTFNITTFRINYLNFSQIIGPTLFIIVTTTTLIRSCKFP